MIIPFLTASLHTPKYPIPLLFTQSPLPHIPHWYPSCHQNSKIFIWSITRIIYLLLNLYHHRFIDNCSSVNSLFYNHQYSRLVESRRSPQMRLPLFSLLLALPHFRIPLPCPPLLPPLPSSSTKFFTSLQNPIPE